jgi:hypothetical protein
VLGKSIPWGLIVFGLLAAGIGTLIYFVLPLGLVSMDIGLLVIVFMVLLVSLVLGAILLTYQFEHGL